LKPLDASLVRLVNVLSGHKFGGAYQARTESSAEEGRRCVTGEAGYWDLIGPKAV
jgi:hypothetical protein